MPLLIPFWGTRKRRATHVRPVFAAALARAKQARTQFRVRVQNSVSPPDGAPDNADTSAPHAAVLGAKPCDTSGYRTSGRAPQVPRKPDVTTRPGTAKFFFARALLMALTRPVAGRGRTGCAFSTPLAVTPRLRTTASTPRMATPIASRRTPHRPASGCLHARLAAIAR